MLARLSTALAAFLVAVWFLYHGLGLISFAKNINGAYATAGMLETVGTVTDTGSVPFVPRDTVMIDQPPGTVQVAPAPSDPAAVGEPRTVLVDPDHTGVARYKHADLSRPGGRYYVAGGLGLAGAAGFAAAGVRIVVRVANQRSGDVDEERVRFADHHRHGA